jgi:hypothetical protein
MRGLSAISPSSEPRSQYRGENAWNTKKNMRDTSAVNELAAGSIGEFRFPRTKSEDANAVFRDGILEITVKAPKRTKSREIRIGEQIKLRMTNDELRIGHPHFVSNMCGRLSRAVRLMLSQSDRTGLQTRPHMDHA